MKMVLVNLLLSMFVIVGLFLMIKGAKAVLEAAASSHWPQTTGLIRESRVVVSHSSGRHGNSTSYSPVISYTYSVGGKMYVGTDIYPGRSWGSHSSYLAVQNFPAGASRPVFYSPDHPQEALLETGLRPAAFQLFIGGCLFLTFSMVFCTGMYLDSNRGVAESRRRSLPHRSLASKVMFVAVALIVSEFILLFVLSD